MANFHTEIQLQSSDEKFSHSDVFFAMGSCFSTEVSKKIAERKFKICTNPFGILFHPLAIENALIRIYSLQHYQISELFHFKELYLSWDHHSEFNDTQSGKMLSKINDSIDIAYDYLRNSNVIFITLGTSFVYKLNSMQLPVANCHKVPNSQFTKFLLTENEIVESLQSCVDIIQDISKNNPKIIFTVSPVRHIKDGFVENTISKARLLNSVFEITSKNKNTEYFPSFEIMLDELRDYRYYKQDMLHPNELAIEYIWEKFSSVYFQDKTIQLNDEIEKLQTGLQHKPFNNKTLAHKEFLYQLMKKFQEIEKKLYPNACLDEFTFLKSQLEHAY